MAEDRADPPPMDVYRDAGVLLTGATGFVGKVILEKLLRSVPELRRVFLLVRPRKGVSAAERVRREVLESPVMGRVPAGAAARKVEALEGDVCSEGLALAPAALARVRREVSVVIHCAATVAFDEPLEAAYEMNCQGALHVLALARSLAHCASLVHVSTAYVAANRRGVVREELAPLDFDVDALAAGREPSTTYPNTYTLTKAAAEHLVARERAHVPVTIVRPSIVGAAWKEPFPGWVDTVSAAGAIFLPVGLGMLTILPGNPRAVADVVPVDLCANYCIAAAALQPPGAGSLRVVHCTSSSRNPLRWRIANSVVPDYFRANPPRRALGPARFSMIQNELHFQLRWLLSYAAPAALYSAAARQAGSAAHERRAAHVARQVWRARKITETFRPFTTGQWVFETPSAAEFEGLDPARLPMDPTDIVWMRYMHNFAYGLSRWILHEDLFEVGLQGVNHTELAITTGNLVEWDADHHRISFPGLFSDVSWAYTSSRRPGYTRSGVLGRLMGVTGWKEGVNHEAAHVPRASLESTGDTCARVLESARVRAAVRAEAARRGCALADVAREARETLRVMAADMDAGTVRRLAWLARKVWRRLYDGILVDEPGLEAVRAAAARADGPLLLLPTHRSYVDFVLLSYVFFAYNLPVPFIAAGDDFLRLGRLSKTLRQAGAFFMRRSFNKGQDQVYQAVFAEYVQTLLCSGHCVELFVEGTRSRSGKQLCPRTGLLRVALEPLRDGRLQRLYVAPVIIDYEKPLEASLLASELLGADKVPETPGALLRSLLRLRRAGSFGHISVRFAPVVTLTGGSGSGVPAPRALAFDVTRALQAGGVCMPTHLVATLLLLYPHGLTQAQLVERVVWLRELVLARGGQVACVEGRERGAVVARAVQLLGPLAHTRREGGLVAPARDAASAVALGYYRNKLLHWFGLAGLAAVAGASRDKARLAARLLRRELALPDDCCCVGVDGGGIGAAADEQALLRSFVLPLLGSYWVAVRALQQGGGQLPALVAHAQWLAETLFHEGELPHLESCSKDALSNAFAALEEWGVVALADGAVLYSAAALGELEGQIRGLVAAGGARATVPVPVLSRL